MVAIHPQILMLVHWDANLPSNFKIQTRNNTWYMQRIWDESIPRYWHCRKTFHRAKFCHPQRTACNVCFSCEQKNKDKKQSTVYDKEERKGNWKHDEIINLVTTKRFEYLKTKQNFNLRGKSLFTASNGTQFLTIWCVLVMPSLWGIQRLLKIKQTSYRMITTRAEIGTEGRGTTKITGPW